LAVVIGYICHNHCGILKEDDIGQRKEEKKKKMMRRRRRRRRRKKRSTKELAIN